MNLNELLQIGGGGLLLIAAIGVLVGNVYYVLRSKTGKIQKEQIAQLKIDFANCESKHTDSQNQINHLQGQVDVLKDIPLHEIRDGIKVLTDNSEKNRLANENVVKVSGRILDKLKDSTITLTEDSVDTKVRTVKSDLEAA